MSVPVSNGNSNFLPRYPAYLVQNRLHLVGGEAHARIDLLDERRELVLVVRFGRERGKKKKE